MFVRVVVTDVDEPPAFPPSLTASSILVQKAAAAGTMVVQLNARDPEGGPVRRLLIDSSSPSSAPPPYSVCDLCL